MLTAGQLHLIVPKANNLEQWTGLLNKYMEVYAINTKPRIAAFLANVAVESDSFNAVKEYGPDSYFYKYEARKDLGNSQDGDGLKFKGRGLIQITGRSMYSACSAALFSNDILLANPELLEVPSTATASACWFWVKVKELNVIADKPEDWTRLSKNGNTYEKFHWICRLVNGGDNGLASRKQFYAKANEIL